ncbi:hypothetical protein L207DRAFT_520195 [Hyaloscypha variabilis F]|uniref:Uncharacterized protein n=1 Tax=Hyaloscypha variabilis (strain UAMH 11265 / GT02V1 / F) TaxID=1149755 RepID=A0A2J6QVR0_HYAVF|nr:hypothetical protein L207DRAFT_520195 [Hyaloscypha variabilis F]
MLCFTSSKQAETTTHSISGHRRLPYSCGDQNITALQAMPHFPPGSTEVYAIPPRYNL